MIKLNQAVIVEGKYDKITLQNIIDATIIPTDGFAVFKNEEKRALIRLFAQKTGVIIITDSDSAGALIRSHLKQICPEGTITNVYIPQLAGKEKRKNKPSKEGLLGVEGMSSEIIIDALNRSGISCEMKEKSKDKKITKTLLFQLGLSGKENSSFLRENLLEYLNLPRGISSNAFLDCINTIYEYDEFIKVVDLWQKNQQEGDKR